MIDAIVNPYEFTEVVYLPEVDKNSKELIREVTRVLKERSATTNELAPAPAPVDNADLVSLGGRVVVAENDLKWHRGVGWGVAALAGGAFLFLLTYYIPKEVTGVKESFSRDLDGQKKDIMLSTTSQLNPIAQQLAAVAAKLEVLTPGIQTTLGGSLKSKATGQGPQLRLNLQTADELAKQALATSIRTDPKDVGEAGESFIEIASTVKNETDERLAWKTISSIVNYRSYLFSNPARYAYVLILPPCPVIPAGSVLTLHNPGAAPRQMPPIKSFAVRNCAIDLDKHEPVKGMVFEECLVKYSGGPVALDDVTFKNCVFLLSLELVPKPAGRQFSKTLLASNLQSFHVASITASP